MNTNHHLSKPVYIGEIRPDGQFNTVWKTRGPVKADAWSKYIQESAKLTADWSYPWVCDGRVMGEVIYPKFSTTLDLPANRVLEAAVLDPPLDTVVVLGKDKDGKLYFASSTGDCGEIKLLMMRADTAMLDAIRLEYGD